MKPTLALLAAAVCATFTACAASPVVTDPEGAALTLEAGHPSLRKWLLPADVPSPADNQPTPERIALGEKLFFDARLSVHGRTSCASCHMPERGWTDGVPRSLRFMGEATTRNSQTLINVGFHQLYNWDGKNKSLEQQATSSQSMTGSMAGGAKEAGVTDPNLGIERIKKIAGYQELFAKAYPGEPVNQATAGKAIAAFERTLVSRDTPFDRWVKGDAAAMTPSQVNGFRVFLDAAKGNCAACHAAPHFTDQGFHNIGVKQAGGKPDAGRFAVRAMPAMKGAFKTPSLREVAWTAPYFHDGSAVSLKDVVEHYARGGDDQSNLSINMKPLALTDPEKADLVAFMQALSSPQQAIFDAPRLPR